MARFLAIDWDQNQLHVIAADIRGKGVQVRRAVITAESQTPNPANAEELGKLLAERLKAAGIAAAPVLACVGRDRLLVKEIRYPRVPETEEAAIVRFQTVKELTDSPEDVVIDYMTTASPPEGEQRAMALVLRREILQTFRTLCEAAGLKLAAVTPRMIGTAACLGSVMGKTVVTPVPEPADGVVCAVVLGEKQAELGIFKGQIPLLTRALANASNLAAEVRRNLAVHAGQSPQFPVRAVYLAGKGAIELRERLGDLVETPVYTFDPFAGSEAVDLPTGNRGTFAGAMGLLQISAAGDLPINFVSPRQPKPPTNANRRLLRLGLVASIALFIGLVVLGRVLHASWSGELTAIQEQREEVEKRLLATTEAGKRFKLIDDWDTVVWEDEIYDLTARIPDVNALRLVSVAAEALAPSPKTRAAAKLTIKGTLLNKGNPRKPLDQLVSQFSKDGFYSPEAPRVENDKFTLIVYVERRGPTDYRYRIKDPDAADAIRPKESNQAKSKNRGANEP